MDAAKICTFYRDTRTASCEADVVPGDTVDSIVNRIRPELELAQGGQWRFVREKNEEVLVGDIYEKVEAFESIIVYGDLKGGC